MIYTKNKLKDGTVVRSPITEGSTYARCDRCAAEIQTDLRELFDGSFPNPYERKVICADCTRKMIQSERIDFDTIVLLATMIGRLGYHEEIAGVYSLFDILDIKDLEKDDYAEFAEELISAVARRISGEDGPYECK